MLSVSYMTFMAHVVWASNKVVCYCRTPVFCKTQNEQFPGVEELSLSCGSSLDDVQSCFRGRGGWNISDDAPKSQKMVGMN